MGTRSCICRGMTCEAVCQWSYNKGPFTLSDAIATSQKWVKWSSVELITFSDGKHQWKSNVAIAIANAITGPKYVTGIQTFKIPLEYATQDLSEFYQIWFQTFFRFSVSHVQINILIWSYLRSIIDICRTWQVAAKRGKYKCNMGNSIKC